MTLKRHVASVSPSSDGIVRKLRNNRTLHRRDQKPPPIAVEPWETPSGTCVRRRVMVSGVIERIGGWRDVCMVPRAVPGGRPLKLTAEKKAAGLAMRDCGDMA